MRAIDGEQVLKFLNEQARTAGSPEEWHKWAYIDSLIDIFKSNRFDLPTSVPEGMELVNSSHYRKLLEANGERGKYREALEKIMSLKLSTADSEELAEIVTNMAIIGHEALAPKEPKP